MASNVEPDIDTPFNFRQRNILLPKAMSRLNRSHIIM